MEVQETQVLADHLFRSSAGQMVSHLTRILGPAQIELAEEAVQEAMLRALKVWPHGGVPDNPSAWLFQVARNAAFDALRRHKQAQDKEGEVAFEIERQRACVMPDESEIRDDELRMIFLCCHPSLSSESSVALALTTVGGFGVDELARAFLTQRATIAQRLVRAKRNIRESGIGFELPASAELNARLDSVLEVLYLMFNEGYAAHAGEQLVREDLCREALRLARLVAGSPFGAPRAHALASLMAFQAARFPARMDAQGRMVLLEDQDRTRWDRHLIGEGFRQLAASAEGDEISPYHVQAAIAAEHAKGSDWTRVLELFDELLELTPSPIVRLNRAVAVAKVHGSEAALRELDRLADEPSLRNYYLYLAIRARLLWELGDRISASHLYREAMRAQCSEPERQFLSTRLEACLA